MIKFFLKNGANSNARVNIDGWLGDTPFLTVYHQKKDKKQEYPDEKFETIEFVKKNFRIIKPDFNEMLNQCVKVLLEYNTCPFILNASGDSPLHRASAKLDTINLRLMCKAKPSSNDAHINAHNEKGQTPLMTAVATLAALIKIKKEEKKISVIKSLLQANADPNVTYENGDTVFIKAIKTSHLPLFQCILEHSVVGINYRHQNNSMYLLLRDNEHSDFFFFFTKL